MHYELLLKGPSLIDLHFQIFSPCSFLGVVGHPPLLLGLHHLLNFTSEMNESSIKDAFFTPCFDTQPMAFPPEIKLLTCCPSLPFPLAFHSPTPLPLPPPLSGYHADTPITIKAEPSIWPTAAFINIHEHP